MDNRDLISWFESQDGNIDSNSIGFREIPGQGRGAIALRDIPDNYTLFTIPRSLTLSTRTSRLPQIMGVDQWKRLHLDKGWAGLILCMMWEESRGKVSPWYGYLATLPQTFSTPMFWNDEDLRELNGSAVLDKIGKASAELEYHEKIIPALRVRPDLFAEALVSSIYSLENFHNMGSRILSRSFTVEQWIGDEEGDEEDTGLNVPGSDGLTMEVDDQATEHTEGQLGHLDLNDEVKSDKSSDSDSEEEDPSDVAMVPLADMLNAQFGSENAKVFYGRDALRMITTNSIKEGEQIYNTYGDPPNSDLLRRYGHVDLVPLKDGSGRLGNPADIVEIRADFVVSVLEFPEERNQTSYSTERIEWWLEEGEDDVFVLEGESVISEPLVSFTKLMLCSEAEWKKTRDKGRPPKPKIDRHVLPWLTKVIQKRLEEYPTTLEADEERLRGSTFDIMSLNKRNALVVRVGEKRLLKSALDILQRRAVDDMEVETTKNEGKSKRKRDSVEGREQGKKSRR